MVKAGFDYSTFLSPFTWRYGSLEMRKVFSEMNYRALWRRIWVSLAEAQGDYGLVCLLRYKGVNFHLLKTLVVNHTL